MLYCVFLFYFIFIFFMLNFHVICWFYFNSFFILFAIYFCWAQGPFKLISWPKLIQQLLLQAQSIKAQPHGSRPSSAACMPTAQRQTSSTKNRLSMQGTPTCVSFLPAADQFYRTVKLQLAPSPNVPSSRLTSFSLCVPITLPCILPTQCIC